MKNTINEAIEEMLQYFDEHMKEFEEALEKKEYTIAGTIQGYLLGVMQCIVIAYKNQGDKKIPKEVEERLDKINLP
ncbi:hypothetical protein [Velocimicrobium porci]|uniref:Uncharacterized protein n=1 Tax=Velocimicrobium porci TaxID=2606634 RepID=A0A6L5XYZ6_9FIRM|nr:hypothetical protein [Velocimicrobium porci]MSS63163.1 hypothetical protein [Velocimicrobium porci]